MPHRKGRNAESYLEWLAREAAKSGLVRLAQKERAQEFGRSQRTIRRYESHLKRLGLIRVGKAMDRETFVVLVDRRRSKGERGA